ncbi:MAG TPA: NAD(P)/FAD-dependent oxidoreductase [Candidatus Angelobacter sp.]|jgi:pyruvate/2-oxoglutarate dehydrogenase complex dihydrolipoamide dehydrogenase (E3) component|nr:NAD(P)/FAD-dependent oxidoreductase [Candidatus Angelobacter sp.]
MAERADLVVIGMGPGGEEVAGACADAGLSVVGIDQRLLGGECPYYGCVPTKMMVRATDALAEARRVPRLAGSAIVTPDWAPVARRIRDEATDNWNDAAAVERFEKRGGRFIRGTGRLLGPGRVAVGDVEIEASRGVVVNTGTEPLVPPVEGLQGTPFWTNREAVRIESVPESLVVLGGGAIGVELAQVFARFGSRVTVLEGMERLIAMEEPEAGDILGEVFRADGIEVRTGVHAVRVTHDGNSFTVSLDTGAPATGEKLLVATGRRACLQAIGLETVGLDPAAKAIAVDTRMRAGERLWAVGDCTGHGAYTHVSMYQARIAARDILGRPGSEASYHALPRVTFTDPEVGAVGLTEKQARDRGIEVRTATAPMSVSARGWIHGPGNEGLFKLVADPATGTLVGATAMAPDGGEVLGLLSLAVHARTPVSVMRDMIYAYPTLHRGLEPVLEALGL